MFSKLAGAVKRVQKSEVSFPFQSEVPRRIIERSVPVQEHRLGIVNVTFKNEAASSEVDAWITKKGK